MTKCFLLVAFPFGGIERPGSISRGPPYRSCPVRVSGSRHAKRARNGCTISRGTRNVAQDDPRFMLSGYADRPRCSDYKLFRVHIEACVTIPVEHGNNLVTVTVVFRESGRVSRYHLLSLLLNPCSFASPLFPSLLSVAFCIGSATKSYDHETASTRRKRNTVALPVISSAKWRT